MDGIAMRIQVLPNGLIIGHVVPKEHPANRCYNLEPNHVYELQIDLTYGNDKLKNIGEADFKTSDVDPRGCSIDHLIAVSSGRHLTVNDGK
ncbi:hypothetical protein pEaSNUABM50_00439 [Erwinia phage pEa_SNUABM_50]|uniref:Uncharacterized protein n=4 Tax=Eneladusvirus BF TaxID=2560751 RepID=A0A7L8ZN48_9CAUD|nr:hypothetical protein FDH34_gp486 [Serratia phage BF]QOI71373.1 hypothetical protein pEaSNUABM12_00445 [Erwinia phage pEa_SNUABM_12]QOI71915.1 hypothetical protein pEaSNUABM47_00441 [Erwinia phage pEa_SNUABM_47]QOI72454.1 hypothetical protein pEaSNUABM50_00439 [Erwinia phage pEa_SNUABM_50]QXO11581.1 hypothetical protein pEaSNUABM19_00445 [Erwinia phage pEa_SNUABM_19]QXO12129.1 hypothetical protein pEaSNUABM44_00443 [Erwinia phage pEa_SNUABM_44]QXO12682.1 hypothetical protein pEaSNUABM49_004